MANSDIETSIQINLSDYDRQMNRAIKQADNLDSALDAISNTKIAPIVEIDTGNLDSVKKQMEAALAGSYTASLDVEDSAIKNAEALLAKLDSESVSVKVSTDDSDIAITKRKIDDLDGETIDPKVNVDDSELTGIKSKLDELRNLAVIDIVFNLADKIPSPADIPLLGSIVEADNAARNLQATLGTGFQPSQAEEAQDLFTSGFGATQTEAAQALAAVVQTTGNEFKTAAESGESFGSIAAQAFTVADISGEDFKAVLDAADKLYSNGQAETYADALDLIATGFQNGLNNGDDLLDTVREYSPQFEQLGFTSGEFFNSLKAGMDAGAYNTDFIADLIKEMNIRAQAAMAGEGVEFDALSAMGLLDEAEAYAAGEITGKAYAEAVAAAAESGLADGSITPQTIFDALGTKAEDLTIPVTLDILGAKGEGGFGINAVEGTTQAAGDALYGGIEASIETAKRLIETELATSIDEAFDIQGKIDAFNTGVKEFSALIAGGEDIPAAIEEAFNLEGFAETFARFESAIGNLVIEVSSLIASILDATGNSGAAADLRGGIATQAAQQLAFDLQLQDDGAGIVSAVDTAIRRGVEAADIGTALTTAGSEFVLSGDFQAAQAYIADLQGLATVSVPPQVTDLLAGRGVDVTNLQAVTAELKEIQAQAALGVSNEGFGIQSLLQSQGINLDELVTTLDYAGTAQTVATNLGTQLDTALFDTFNTMFAEGNYLQGLVTALGTGEGGTAGIFGSEIVTQFQDLPNQLMQGLSNIGGEIPLLTTLQTDLDNTNAKVGEVMPAVEESITTGGIEPFQAFTTEINATAAAMLTQSPIIGEQATQIQTSMGATGVKVDTLNTSIGGLDKASLSALQGEFANLRGGVDEQVGAAIRQINTLISKLTSLGGMSIGIPGFTLSPISGGSHMYGGVIPAGTVGVVHGNEILAGAPPGTDISVLNQQTSSVIESALAALMGGDIGGLFGGADAGGTAPPITQELVLDFQVQTDGQGIQDVIRNAIEGGVDAAELEASLLTAGRDLIAQGDLDKAAKFVEDLQTAATIELPSGLTDYLSGKGIDPTDLQAVREELLAITTDARALGDISEFASPVAGMSLVDFEDLINPLEIAAQAQTALEPLQAELQSALDFQSDLDLGLDIQTMISEALAAGDSSKLSDTLKAILEKASQDASGAFTSISDAGLGMSETAPLIGEAIDLGIGQPIETASGAVSELATLLEEQFPGILEQLGILQTEMDTQDSVNNLDMLKVSIESLNTVSLSGLTGQFAGLKQGIDDQVAYATEQILKLQGALNGLGGTNIGVPDVNIPGIAGDGGSHLYGGVIAGGTIGQVHGNEIFAAAPEGTDISVLNAATSSTIENALAALVGGGVGGNVSNVTYNNQFVYNVQSNAQGFMSEGAARSARGF